MNLSRGPGPTYDTPLQPSEICSFAVQSGETRWCKIEFCFEFLDTQSKRGVEREQNAQVISKKLFPDDGISLIHN